MIVFVGLNTPLSIIDVEIELFEFVKYNLIDGDTMVADDYAAVERNIIDLLAPLMFKNLLYSVSFRRIDVQYFLQQIFEVTTDPVR